MRRTYVHVTACTVAFGLAAMNAVGQQPAAPRQSPPPLGAPKPFRLPPKREFTLPNGMAVTLVPFGTIPKASVFCAVRTGHIDEGANDVWLADVTAAMMREGTATRTATELAEAVAGMGGELTVTAEDDQMDAGGTVLGERAPEMVRLVAEVLRHPRLPDTELARIKADKLRELAIAKSQPQPIAQEAFVRTLYGDHPYGRAFPTEAMLQGYSIDRVRDFHARNVGAARAHLYVVGVYDAVAIERAAREAFGDWSRGSAPTVKPPSPRSGRTVTLLDRPNAVQSTLVLGLPTPGPTSKEYTALQVTDAILGGTFGSRITTNIREQKGYTYSPFSYLDTHFHDAYWAEQADVTTAVTGASLKEIFAEIDRLQREPPPAAELTGIKNNMIGTFTLRNASRGGIVNQLEFVDLQGLGDDYLSGYVKRVMAISPADVQRTMRTHLRPERMALVVVGDRKVVEPQLAPFQTAVP
jgi:zinc protease